MARAMLLNANCNKNLWAEAIATAVYLRNRSSSKALNNKTPNEVCSGKKPSVTHLRVFGSVAVALNKSQKSKLHPKGETLMMVGYSLNSKPYRLYNTLNRKVVEKRDVIFDETKFLPQRGENKESKESFEFILKKPKINDEQKSNNQDLNTNSDEQRSNYENTDEQRSNYEIFEDNCDTMDEEEEVDNSYESDLQENDSSNATTETNNGNAEPRKKGPGRPRIIRNGKPGRARKEYNMLNQLKEEMEIPKTFTEALNGRYSRELFVVDTGFVVTMY